MKCILVWKEVVSYYTAAHIHTWKPLSAISGPCVQEQGNNTVFVFQSQMTLCSGLKMQQFQGLVKKNKFQRSDLLLMGAVVFKKVPHNKP